MRLLLVILILVIGVATLPIAPLQAAEPVATAAGGFAGYADALAVDGDIAYLGEGSGLSLIDLRDSAPSRLAFLPLPARPEDIAVADGLAFVVLGVRGLLVVDVRDPAQPWVRSSIEWPQDDGYIRRLAISVDAVGPLAYVVIGIEAAGYMASGQVHVVDATNPDQPALLGSAETQGFPAEVQVVDGLAYVAALGSPRITGGLRIVDVRDPAAPVALGLIDDLEYGGWSVEVYGGMAYVGRVGVVDVRDPAAPQLLAPFDDDVLRAVNGQGYGVEPGSDRLKIYDLSDPANPVVLNEVGLAAPGESLRPLKMLEAQGGRLYLSFENGLRVFDLADPQQPALAAHLGSGQVSGVFADGGQVYASGVFFWRPDPARATLLVPTTPLTGNPNVRVFQLSAGLAYAERGDSLIIVDIVDPLAAPLGELALGPASPAGEYDWAVDLTGLRVVDGRAYLLVQWRAINTRAVIFENELLIVDVTDPRAPQLLGRSGTGLLGGATELQLVGTRAYVVDGQASLAVFEVADPAAPQALGRIEGLPGGMRTLQAEGPLLYAAGDGGLAIVDLSDPAAPALRGQLALPAPVTAAALAGGQVMLGLNRDGLAIVDSRDPDAPQVLEIAPLAGQPSSIAITGDLVFVASGEEGVRVFRLAAP